MIGEEALQHQLNAVSDEEEEIDASKGKPPVVDDEELAKLDAEACKHEEARLEAMGVLERMKDDEEAEDGSYVLTSKMVITWKHRDEQGGWFRRARLVGRQFKWSVFTEDAFAPTSASVVVRMLLQLQMRLFSYLHRPNSFLPNRGGVTGAKLPTTSSIRCLFGLTSCAEESCLLVHLSWPPGLAVGPSSAWDFHQLHPMGFVGDFVDPMPCNWVHCFWPVLLLLVVVPLVTMGVFVPGVLKPPGLLPGVGGAGVLAGVLGCPSAGNPGVVGFLHEYGRHVCSVHRSSF